MKRACNYVTSKSMVVLKCEFHTTFKKIIITV